MLATAPGSGTARWFKESVAKQQQLAVGMRKPLPASGGVAMLTQHQTGPLNRKAFNRVSDTLTTEILRK